MNCQRGGGRSGMLASSEPGTGGANSNGGTGGAGAGEITQEPFPCAPGSARFTARVKSRGEPATTVMNQPTASVASIWGRRRSSWWLRALQAHGPTHLQRAAAPG